jgi:hypothetical protein
LARPGRVGEHDPNPRKNLVYVSLHITSTDAEHPDATIVEELIAIAVLLDVR